MEKAVARDHSLDGMRGIASLSVVFFHFFCAFFPYVIPEYATRPWRGSDTLVAVVYNGGFAVALFFVLSGFVLSSSAAHSERPLLLVMAQRYVRLAGPVLVSTIFSWVLLAIWADPRMAIREVVDSQWLQFVYTRDLPSFCTAVYHGIIRVFFEGNSYFNNALWTMKIELIGSCLIYMAYINFLATSRLILLAFTTFALIYLARPEYAAFAVGALVREFWTRHAASPRFAPAALVFGLVFGAMTKGFASRALPFFDTPQEGQFALGEPHKFWHVVSAASLLYAILSLQVLRTALSSFVARFLGRISFGLYLVHVPLIYTVFAAFYLRLPNDFPMKTLAVLAFGLPITILAGYVFTIAVDEPIVLFLRMLQKKHELYRAKQVKLSHDQVSRGGRARTD
jgi:peptidoglycan/LPS O-acetylase OafA/YrhL